MADACRDLTRFVGALRTAGLSVPTDAAIVFVKAVAAVGLDRRSAARVYWTGRATLLRRPDDIAVYDRTFAAFFGQRPAASALEETQAIEVVLDDNSDGPDPADNGADPGDEAGPARTVRWSDHEVLRHKDLAECTGEELAEAQRLIARLRVNPALRRTRRHRRDPHHRGRPDLRRTLREATRTSGHVLQLEATRPGRCPRRLVLLLDVSGSMAPYSRSLARFAQAAVAARRQGQVEVFAVGTRVTRITRQLATHDPDRALAEAGATVADWAGGTRLGPGLRAFNDRWDSARGAVVLILSDGWDRGHPRILGTEMARLQRAAHEVIWVNPLKALPGYAPLARGMAAALPHVDWFVEGHSVASLEALAGVVGGAR